MKEIVKILLSNSKLSIDDKSRICRARLIVSIIMVLVASIMLIMNIKINSVAMTYTSIVLVVGFSLTAIIAGVFKNANISGVLIALLVCIVFSAFLFTGGNEGFAILWILLVPLFSISLLGVIQGLMVSVYFLLLIFATFLTPFKSHLEDLYTSNFISRFPFLYFCDFAVATYFSLQREYLQKKLQYQAYTDGMTGIYNRRMFIEQLGKLTSKDTFSIVMVDLNGLKAVNDTYGHKAGDDFICKVSKLTNEIFKDSSIVCRIGGDEIAIIANIKASDVDFKISKLKASANDYKEKVNYVFSYSISVAHSAFNPSLSAEELYKMADEEMYANKMNYYKDAKHNRRQSPRIDVDAKGSFIINFGKENGGDFIGKIADVSEQGIRIEADYEKYESCLQNAVEGQTIAFQAMEEFMVLGDKKTEIFNGQAEVVRRQIEGGTIILGCKVKPLSKTFDKYISERKMSIFISQLEKS